MIVVKRTLLLLSLSSLGASASAVIFGGPTTTEYFDRVTTDNNGNVYVLGTSTPDPLALDLLVASFNSSGVLRWNNTFDGGLGVNDDPDVISVFNSNVHTAYRSDTSVGVQSFNRVTGAYGAQTLYATPPLGFTQPKFVGDTAVFVGSRNIGGFVDAAIMRVDGITLPTPTFYGTSGYTVFHDSVTIASGTYVTGDDANGKFVAKWDFTTGSPIWITNLPATATPYKIEADAAGNLFVAGTIVNTNRDLAVWKYSPAGAFLGQGIADSGYEDLFTTFALAGSKPVLTGRYTNAGSTWLYAAALRANLTVGYAFIDQQTYNAEGLTTDADYAYLVGRSTAAGDDSVFKFSVAGMFWSRVINQSASTERVTGIVYKSGMLLICGAVNGDALLYRLSPATGLVMW